MSRNDQLETVQRFKQDPPRGSRAHYVFEKACRLGWSQASEEKPEADEIHEHLLGASQPYIVLAEAPLPAHPGNSAFDDLSRRGMTWKPG